MGRYGKILYAPVLSAGGSLAYVPFNPTVADPSDREAGIEVVRIPPPLDLRSLP